jgi:hypothetical protein
VSVNSSQTVLCLSSSSSFFFFLEREKVGRCRVRMDAWKWERKKTKNRGGDGREWSSLIYRLLMLRLLIPSSQSTPSNPTLTKYCDWNRESNRWSLPYSWYSSFFCNYSKFRIENWSGFCVSSSDCFSIEWVVKWKERLF